MCLAIPAEVVRLEGTTATVSVEGARRDVDVSLIEEVSVGDYVLVHAGFALHRWDEEDYRIWKEIHDQMLGALDSPASDADLSPGFQDGEEPFPDPGAAPPAAGGEAEE
jgi:hydrogenase expression/formation protein HypC